MHYMRCFKLLVPLDHVVALEEQVARLKEMCKVLSEERDTAVINYAVVEGVCIIVLMNYARCYGDS